MTPRQIIRTQDGSWSLYDPHLDETYHSRHGALQESEHVFIRHGLCVAAKHFSERPLRVLEMGLGTGLNALLTKQWAENQNLLPLYYHGLEAYPLTEEEVGGLTAAMPEPLKPQATAFHQIHQQPWGQTADFDSGFRFHKEHNDVRDFYWNQEGFHLIYYDAFAPNKQPDVWTEAVLEQMYQLLKKGGMLTTYCAQGQFRRTLRNCGFTVYSPSGPNGKKEMTLATKGSLPHPLKQQLAQ